MLASENGHVEVVKLLMAAGANVRARSNVSVYVCVRKCANIMLAAAIISLLHIVLFVSLGIQRS
jgi:ankyrin repeat protein